MFIQQAQLENLTSALKPGKVVVIYGARRTGKTTLLKEFLVGETAPYLLVSGEDITGSGSSTSRKSFPHTCTKTSWSWRGSGNPPK